jgi:tetratricopeptide (TPR) repeat protein
MTALSAAVQLDFPAKPWPPRHATLLLAVSLALLTLALCANSLSSAFINSASDPLESAQAHNNLGVLLMQKNQPAKAPREFDAAIRINPTELNSFIGRGSVEFQTGNLSAALGDFTHATQIAPSPIAYFWLGRTFEGQQDLRSALRAYEGAARIAPEFAVARDRANFLRRKIQN